MIQSYVDTIVAEKEFALMNDQTHFEKVFSKVNINLPNYIEGFLEEAQKFEIGVSPRDSVLSFLNNILFENDCLHDRYHAIFSNSKLMKYGTNPKAFKDVCLKKECDLIRHTLSAKTASLNEWKMKFHRSTPESLYKTFVNFLNFAADYNDKFTETLVNEITNIYDFELNSMDHEGCYKAGVIGYGVVSNILGHMYPRVFPGEYRSGIFALYFLSGGNKLVEEIPMMSDTSEFVMVKNTVRSRTGIIETEHNFFFPYFVYAMYSLKIYKELQIALKEKFDVEFDDNHRYLLTNAFFSYVIDRHREEIKTLNGNDDIYKYKIAC